MPEIPRPISVGELLQKEFPPDQNLVEPKLLSKGSLFLIGGPPKSYKSFLLTDMIVALATGKPLWNVSRSTHGRPEPTFTVIAPQKVLVLEQEIGEYDLKQRFEWMFTTLSHDEQELAQKNISIYSCDHRMRLDEEKGFGLIRMLIEQAKPDIVAFDPLIEFHCSDENSAEEMSRIFHNLDSIKEIYSVSVLMTHHLGKPGQHDFRSGPEKLRGSSFIFGKGDTFAIIERKAVKNSKAPLIAVDFTIRRGKPVPGISLILNYQNLRFDFAGWGKSNKRILEEALSRFEQMNPEDDDVYM